MDSLAAYATMTCTDEAGANLNDSSMFLTSWTSDENPVLPSVTLTYMGMRGGVGRGVLAEDDTSLQTAQTTKQITDANSLNYQKTLTCSVTYISSRTTYKWAALANPGATPTYSAVRNIPVLNMGSAGIVQMTFSGMVDANDQPSGTIPIGEATAVFNTFSTASQTTTFTVSEAAPGKLWQCQSVNEYILKGA